MQKIKCLKDEYTYYGLEKCLAPDETPEMAEGFFLTAFKANELNLTMNVFLRCLENKGDKPFLRFQNDKNSKFNSNWIKIYINGKIDNYENKTIVFSESELNNLKKWIHQNQEAITKHYYQEYDSADVCKKIKALKT